MYLTYICMITAALPLGCKAIPCNQSIMKYCLGPQFINDHCWCEQGHEEGKKIM